MTDLVDSATRVLSTTVPRWQSLVETAPDDLLRRPPAPGDWCARECLDHLVLTEGVVFGTRLRAILDGRDLPVFDPNAPHLQPERTPAEAAAAFAAVRAENLEVLRGVTSADLERTGQHPEYGPVSLAVLLSTWAAHDLQHTVQAEEAMMQAFLPGTGPFRFRFAAHEVGRGT